MLACSYCSAYREMRQTPEAEALWLAHLDFEHGLTA